jgi:hypothetical protein
METLQTTLQNDYANVVELSAVFETWKAPDAGWLNETEFETTRSPKLYQPAQGRFYLVAASLVCKLPGLPEKTVQTNRQERVSFVMRRLVPKNGQAAAATALNLASFDEYAWFPTQGWLPLQNRDRLADYEERLPMFGMNFCHDGVLRRVLLGMIPVSSRETFQAPPSVSLLIDPDTGQPIEDPRVAEFESTVANGLSALRQGIENEVTDLSGAKAEEILLMILLDFADFIHTHLNGNYNAFSQMGSTFREVGSQKRLWSDAVKYAWDNRTAIRAGNLSTIPYFSGLNSSQKLKAITDADVELKAYQVINGQVELTESFKNNLDAALPDSGDTSPAEGPLEMPKYDPEGADYFLVRCVYERPECVVPFSDRVPLSEQLPPSARLLHQPVVSKPSQPFQLAGFFDPDAPARPVRIAMPVDTSPQGLRKFPRSVSVMISDQLKQQMERVKGITELEKGELNNPDLEFGMICSLSIPIITICALILLMIIVQLLNIVFWWLPFFKICIPCIIGKK